MLPLSHTQHFFQLKLAHYCDIQQVKPVLRGHFSDQEKVAL